jgi:hypothetical protein
MNRPLLLYVLAALLSALLITLVVVGEKRYDERVARSQTMFSEASALEARGDFQSAYHRYSTLCEGGLEIKRADVPAGACEGAERLSRSIENAYKHAMRALDSYRSKNGRYPTTLVDFVGDIPAEFKTAFWGFRYARTGDDKAEIVTGLYGPVSFNLHR